MSNLPENESQSFLLRIWREDPCEDSSPPSFRGHMTCLLDGTRVYVQSWIEIQAFINSYMEAWCNASAPAVAELHRTGEASKGQF